MRRLVAIPFVLLVPSLSQPFSTHAQPPPDSSSVTTTHSLSDSVQHVSAIPLISLTGTRIDTLRTQYRPSKSPAFAMLLSAILPGAGQVYNTSYWKVPIIVGFGVYFTSQWLDQNRRYIEARDKYRESLSIDPSGDSRELARRDFYRDQRDMFTWYMAILYFINIADAYVDASLYDFNVGGDLSIRFVPEIRSLMRLQVNF